VFSRNTDKEKDNVFPWETVGIKINFFCLFPWKTIKETGFLFWIQTDGIILLCFLFVCVGMASARWWWVSDAVGVAGHIHLGGGA